MTVATISLPVPQAVIATYPDVPESFVIPDGSTVHAAGVGWVSQDGKYSLVDVIPFTIPPGQQTSGPPTYAVSGGVVTETYPTIPIPAPNAASAKYQAAITAGVALTWSSSTALNATYPIDQVTMANISNVFLSVVNNGQYPTGNVVRPWPDINHVQHNMSVIQFKLFAPALVKYTDQLVIAAQTDATGGTGVWPPPNVSITG